MVVKRVEQLGVLKPNAYPQSTLDNFKQRFIKDSDSIEMDTLNSLLLEETTTDAGRLADKKSRPVPAFFPIHLSLPFVFSMRQVTAPAYKTFLFLPCLH